MSMALSRSEHCQMTLLAFGDGESISEERYFGDTVYYVLEGDMPLRWRDTRSAWAQGIVWLSRRRPPTPLAGAAPSNCCKLPSNQN